MREQVHFDRFLVQNFVFFFYAAHVLDDFAVEVRWQCSKCGVIDFSLPSRIELIVHYFATSALLLQISITAAAFGNSTVWFLYGPNVSSLNLNSGASNTNTLAVPFLKATAPVKGSKSWRFLAGNSTFLSPVLP